MKRKCSHKPFHFLTFIPALQFVSQDFLHVPKPPPDTIRHSAFSNAFCPGNISYTHTKNEMSVNALCLFIRQPGNGGMEFLHSHFMTSTAGMRIAACLSG